MPLRPRQQIPTVADVCRDFVETRSHQKGIRELRSTLLGAQSRTVGRRARGTSLARSEHGTLRFDRVEGHEFAAWLNGRFGDLSASSHKRARSHLRQLLLYAVGQGYAEPEVLNALPPTSDSPPRHDWLRPEQVVAIDDLVTDAARTGALDRHAEFAWRCPLETGLRAQEVVTLQPRALVASDRVLDVLGKGRGDGKRRTVPVSDEFIRYWTERIVREGLRTWMWPLSKVEFAAGSHRDTERVFDVTRHGTQKSLRTALARVEELVEDEAKAGNLALELVPAFRLTPHVLRRTYACGQLVASQLLGDGYGLDLRSLQKAMGHSSLEVVALYLADVDEYLSRFRRSASLAASARQIVAKTAELSLANAA